jgi:hypothetical protein
VSSSTPGHVTPCFVIAFEANNEEEAMKTAQSKAAEYGSDCTAIKITESHYYDPKTCGNK